MGKELTSLALSEYQKTETLIIEHEDFETECQSIAQMACLPYATGTFNKIFFEQNIDNISMSENEKSIFKLYTEINESHSTCLEDIVLTTNAYIKKISDISTLSYSEKENLLFAIAVAVNSTMYWKRYLSTATQAMPTAQAQ